MFGVCNGLAILRGAPLPNRLGWVAIVMGILFVIPPAIIAAFALVVVWSAIVAVLLVARWADGAEPSPAPAAA